MKPSDQALAPTLFDVLGTEGALESHIQELQEWLRENGKNCSNEQKHLEEGTSERIYWHYGYLSALGDVLKQLRRQHRNLN